MGSLDVLFADLLRNGDALPVATPGDIGDFGDNPRQCSLSGRFDGGDALATSGDIGPQPAEMSPDVATLSPAPNTLQTRASAHLSPMSPMSPDGAAWTDSEIEAFTARYARLVAHGLTDTQAEALVERLVQRDRDGDSRRLCVECAHYRGGRCRQAARSSVGPEVGALALILQNCPAFGPMGD